MEGRRKDKWERNKRTLKEREKMHETVRKEAETSKYVFLLLRARGMYVQLVTTFKTCSWKQHTHTHTHTQYNCDNGLTLPPHKKEIISRSLVFYFHCISLWKNDLSTCLKGFDTSDTERKHKSQLIWRRALKSITTFRYFINNGIFRDRFRQTHMMYGFSVCVCVCACTCVCVYNST